MSNVTNHTSSDGYFQPYALSLWPEVVLCLVTFVGAFISFIQINRWKLKNEKLRQILYISSSSSVLIGAIWVFELVSVFLGYKYHSSFWVFRYSRFWVASFTERMLICIYFIFFFILITKLSMSQVKVWCLALISALIGSISIAEGVYMIVNYPLVSPDGHFGIDSLSTDFLNNHFLNSLDGLIAFASAAELIIIICSYFYVKHMLSCNPHLQRSPAVQSAFTTMRRLLPIFCFPVLSAAIPSLMSFFGTWYPFLNESDPAALIQMIFFYLFWSSIPFLPILVKWAIQPPPSPPARNYRSRLGIRTRRAHQEVQSPPINDFHVIVQINRIASAPPIANAIPDADTLPLYASVVRTINEDDEEGDQNGWDIFAQLERNAANFLGYAAPNTADVVANIHARNALDAESALEVAPGAPGPSIAFFGHEGAFGESSEVDFEALEAIMADRYRSRNGREEEHMFEMDSLYNREGKNLLPDDLM